MGGIIVALPKTEDAKSICEILRRRGMEVSAVCNTGSSILQEASRFDYCVVICTKRFPDMHYTEINGYLPENCKMLLLAPANVLAMCKSEIRTLALPFRPSELTCIVEEILATQRKQIKKNAVPKKRSIEEQKHINDAKTLLMKHKDMTEQEAFRYIQKCSMDSGTNMSEMAQMIISVNYGSI